MTNKEQQFQVRNYQVRLVEHAHQHNSIIYLPTGSGKTYVAVLVLKRFTENLDLPIESGGKRSLFICNTVELARQQAVFLKKTTNLKIGFYVGERGVDNWKRNRWDEEINNHQVLVGTAQVIFDMLTQKFLAINSIGIIIMDECHHGTGQHPYHEIMRFLQFADSSIKLPRIVALSGVLIKGNEIKSVGKKLNELEVTFRSNIVTISNSEEMQNVMLHSTKPRESLISYLSTMHAFGIIDIIKNEIGAFYNVLKDIDIGTQPVRMSKGLSAQRESNKKSFIKTTFNDFLYQLDDLGIYTGALAILSVIVELEVKRREAETLALRELYSAALTLSEKIRHMLMNKMKTLVDDDDINDSINSENNIMNFSSPKVQKFLVYIKKTFKGKQPKDICCLVFVERRMTAKCIYGLLNLYIDAMPELQGVIIPQFMVGRSGISPSFELVLELKWQKTAIQQFRDGEANLMVCSSVLEEGIDVQACNYVLILDKIKTFNMYVQTKGRARAKDADFVLFAPDTDLHKVTMQIQQYRQAHSEIQEYLQARVLDRAEPNSVEIKDHFQDTITPFKSTIGAVLFPSAAAALIHRYCQQLPADTFGIILPWYEIVKGKETTSSGKTIVSLTLPLMSALKETTFSDPMVCPKLAKMSAAFKTCVKLYQIGELNERFMPTSVKERVAAIADVHFDHWKKYGDDVTTTKKTSQEKTSASYPARCPDEFYDAMPRVGDMCYAYAITLEPDFERNDYTAYVHDALKDRATYGLLLRKRLPRLAEMPLFSNQGKLNVRVANEPIQLTISSEHDLQQLQRYHLMQFRDLLGLWKPYYVLDRRSEEYSFLVVPLTPEGDAIDMKLVRKFQRLSSPRPTTVADRMMLEPPRPEDFEGRIITQWYNNFEHRRMIVTKVHTELTPLSVMEGTQPAQTFYDFTMSKYKHYIGEVVHKTQFLIEVRELTERLNFYVNAHVGQKNVQKARAKVLLIPELCYNFQFPGNMWMKLLFLPSILRRLTFILHAEHLRVSINKYLGLDKLPRNGVLYHPKPLVIDCSLRRNVDQMGNAIAMDECEEPKSVLQPLPTKHVEQALNTLEITDLKNSWPEYLEPIDLARNIMSSYPIDLAYYCRFAKGQVVEMTKLENFEKEMCQTQFSMHKGNLYSNTQDANGLAGNTLPALMSSSPTTVGKISILEKSLSNDKITAAEQHEFLSALTTSATVDVFDMERLELLGDCFLKLSATMYLANKYPKWNEGILTDVKSKLVSNRNLLYSLRGTDIPERICNLLFAPKYTWLPPCISLPKNISDLWKEQPNVAALVGPHNLRNLSLSEEEVIEMGRCSDNNFRAFLNECNSNRHTSYESEDFSRDVDFLVHRVQHQHKVVSDTLEAILGVVVKNYGIQHGFRMLKYFDIIKADIGKPLTQLLDLDFSGSRTRTNISQHEIDAFLINHTHLEQNLGYTFRDRAYLLQALTHPSFPTNRLTGCYQELEFIGDAILDFLISAYIFEHREHMTPGGLTDLRSALVNNSTLACICVRHRLHLFILAENALLAEAITKFADFQHTQGHRVTNHVRILLEESDLQQPKHDTDDEEETKEHPTGKYNMAANCEVPKALGDVVEALIAAIYLDCRSLQRTWEVVYNLLEPEIIEFSRNVPINPIRELFEHKLANPRFEPPNIQEECVMVTCQFTCIDKLIKVHGFGHNAKQAKLAAAKFALRKLAKAET